MRNYIVERHLQNSAGVFLPDIQKRMPETGTVDADFTYRMKKEADLLWRGEDNEIQN